MIYPKHLRIHIVRPALEHMGLYSKAAENLVVGTAITESTVAGDTYFVQSGNGPARSPWQIEEATHKDVEINFLQYRPNLKARLDALRIEAVDRETNLTSNLLYAAAVCRLVYFRRPEALPDANDIEGLATYWKSFYNTYLGAGTVEHFVRKYSPHH